MVGDGLEIVAVLSNTVLEAVSQCTYNSMNSNCGTVGMIMKLLSPIVSCQ